MIWFNSNFLDIDSLLTDVVFPFLNEFLSHRAVFHEWIMRYHQICRHQILSLFVLHHESIIDQLQWLFNFVQKLRILHLLIPVEQIFDYEISKFVQDKIGKLNLGQLTIVFTLLSLATEQRLYKNFNTGLGQTKYALIHHVWWKFLKRKSVEMSF